MSHSPLIIGSGPAGLSAAFRLTQNGQPAIILESDPTRIGGLSCSVRFGSCRFDIGGHRFFTKSPEVEAFWQDILGSEFLLRDRISRILYRDQYFSYPLDVAEVLRKLGPSYSCKCLLSFALARLLPRPTTANYEDWMINSFGEVLFDTFFRSYTEKVWGIPCNQLSSDWAAQRTKGVNGWSILKRFIGLSNGNSKRVRSFVEQFSYPRLGAGQMWEAVAKRVQTAGGDLRMGCTLERLSAQPDGRLQAWYRRADGSTDSLVTSALVSSAPICALIHALQPAAPEKVLDAAKSLRHRDFIIVVFKVRRRNIFPDNWIYVHDPSVHVGRIQNFNNWSGDLVPEPDVTLLGMEYFCFFNDPQWVISSERVMEQAWCELARLRIVRLEEEHSGCVVHAPQAYPIYDQGYKENLTIIKEFLQQQYPQIQLIGRNGMHRYNNQDHSVMTGFLAARNILENTRKYDLWKVNEDACYHEEEQVKGR